jgi:ribosomal protein L3
MDRDSCIKATAIKVGQQMPNTAVEGALRGLHTSGGYKKTPVRKIGMSQVFDGSGKLLTVTKFEMLPVREHRDGAHREGPDRFLPGEQVSVLARPKGKGFQGNQKRHGFKRGPMTHGSKNHRLPGSIGAGSDPGRVFPGKKMAGRRKSSFVRTKGLEVLCVLDPHLETNGLLVLRGVVAGGVGSKAFVLSS